MITTAESPVYPVRHLRRSPGRRQFGFRGLGSVSLSQLQNPVPGSQPSFIKGSYPNATWSDLNSFSSGLQFYMPYSQAQINANLPGSGNMVNLNQCVVDQMMSLFGQYTPGVVYQGTRNDSYCGFPLAVYGSPSISVPASVSAPAPAPTLPAGSQVGLSPSDIGPSVPLSSVQSGAPLYGSAAPQQSVSVSSSGIPTWVWLVGAAIVGYVAVKAF